MDIQDDHDNHQHDSRFDEGGDLALLNSPKRKGFLTHRTDCGTDGSCPECAGGLAQPSHGAYLGAGHGESLSDGSSSGDDAALLSVPGVRFDAGGVGGAGVKAPPPRDWTEFGNQLAVKLQAAMNSEVKKIDRDCRCYVTFRNAGPSKIAQIVRSISVTKLDRRRSLNYSEGLGGWPVVITIDYVLTVCPRKTTPLYFVVECLGDSRYCPTFIEVRTVEVVEDPSGPCLKKPLSHRETRYMRPNADPLEWWADQYGEILTELSHPSPPIADGAADSVPLVAADPEDLEAAGGDETEPLENEDPSSEFARHQPHTHGESHVSPPQPRPVATGR